MAWSLGCCLTHLCTDPAAFRPNTHDKKLPSLWSSHHLLRRMSWARCYKAKPGCALLQRRTPQTTCTTSHLFTTGPLKR